jgi:xanthine dehydrogenase accessory factor
MDDLFPHLQLLSKTERRVAMATLVSTKGTTPKKEGAKMWVGEGGRVLGSVTIGGCVDARVIDESEKALRDGGPRRLEMSLGDEDAWELGLTCGGSIELLVEPLALGQPGGDAPCEVVARYQTIDDELQAGRGVVLVRLLGAPEKGLLVMENGETQGSVGDLALDEAARLQALPLLAKNTSRSEQLGAPGEDGGPEAFFEVHAPRPHLVLVGAGAVAMPLVAMGKHLGFRSTVLDPRPRFASRDRFPDADALEVGIASELVAAIRMGPATSVIVTIHDYKVEVPVLDAVLRSGAGYVGMLGNRRRGEAVLQALREKGRTEAEIARVHVPIGLDLGARSAAEIALSVLAEVIAVRSGKAAQSLRGPAK